MEELPEDVIPISVLKNENIDKIEDRINQLFFDNAGLVEKMLLISQMHDIFHSLKGRLKVLKPSIKDLN